MPCVVGPALSNIERLDALAAAPACDLGVADRRSVFEEEQMVMADFAGRDVSVFLAQGQMAL